MARSTDPRDGLRLFEKQERVLERRLRRQRALFIPRLVEEVAKQSVLDTPARSAAHAIAIRWADMESSGQLHRYKETGIDTQFLDQLFGEGLGYKVKTLEPDRYQMEHKFSVPSGGTADGALGDFPGTGHPTALIELKAAGVDLDRDRSQGRTAVQQCWDYLNAMPECPWGIVSNFSLIRLYHKSKGYLTYEEFALQELRDPVRFAEFYAIFERGGLLSTLGRKPRALDILEGTEKRQREVGDVLYKHYQRWRAELIEYLQVDEKKSLDEAIRISQKLLDRIMFIAFCEDRFLLPRDTLKNAVKDLPLYTRARNPAWQNFLGLFRTIDEGGIHKGKDEITAFNGGLFAEDEAIDNLELQEEKWTNAFAAIGDFDFSEEVNVDVLGHLFERSITELEKWRVGGLFAIKAGVEDPAPPARPRKLSNGRGKPTTVGMPTPTSFR